MGVEGLFLKQMTAIKEAYPAHVNSLLTGQAGLRQLMMAPTCLPPPALHPPATWPTSRSLPLLPNPSAPKSLSRPSAAQCPAPAPLYCACLKTMASALSPSPPLHSSAAILWCPPNSQSRPHKSHCYVGVWSSGATAPPRKLLQETPPDVGGWDANSISCNGISLQHLTFSPFGSWPLRQELSFSMVTGHYWPLCLLLHYYCLLSSCLYLPGSFFGVFSVWVIIAPQPLEAAAHRLKSPQPSRPLATSCHWEKLPLLDSQITALTR